MFKLDTTHAPLASGASSAASTTSIMTSMASNNPTSTSSVTSSQQIVVGGPQSHSYPPWQSYVNYPSGQDNGNNEPIYGLCPWLLFGKSSADQCVPCSSL